MRNRAAREGWRRADQAWAPPQTLDPDDEGLQLDDSVGGEDDLTGYPVRIDAGVRLCCGQAESVVARKLVFQGFFVDIGGQHAIGHKADLGQQLQPARRGRRQDQARAAGNVGGRAGHAARIT